MNKCKCPKVSSSWVMRSYPMDKKQNQRQSCCDLEGNEIVGQTELQWGVSSMAEGVAMHVDAGAMGNTVSGVLCVTLRMKNQRSAPTCWSTDSPWSSKGKKTGLFVWAHLSKTNQAAEAAGRDQRRNEGGEKRGSPSETRPTTMF